MMSSPETNTAPAALEVRDLAVGYGSRDVLEALSLRVEAGSVYALIGRNGSGKSTLIASLLGLRKQRTGTIRVLGRDPWRERAKLMRDVGYVPETPDAPPDARIDRIEAFCRALYSSWDSSGFATRLQRFEISPLRKFGELSRGQKGLVSLSLALGPRPKLLILDDPTLGFDVVAKGIFYEELIGELGERGVTIFVTSHDLGEVERVADRIGILHGRRLAAEGPPDELTGRGVRGAFRPLDELLRDLTDERRKSA